MCGVGEGAISILHEVKARGAKVIVLTDADEVSHPRHADALLKLPEVFFFTAPLFASIPLQPLACYVPRFRGRYVGKPRSLAKPVTVE